MAPNRLLDVELHARPARTSTGGHRGGESVDGGGKGHRSRVSPAFSGSPDQLRQVVVGQGTPSVPEPGLRPGSLLAVPARFGLDLSELAETTHKYMAKRS